MATGQGGVPVDPTRPSPPRVGLIQAALTGQVDAEGKWLNGFAFQALDCIEGGAFDPCAADLELVIPENRANVEFVPFAVWAGYKCSTFTAEFDWTRAVTDALLASESKQVAREFWRGDIARAEGHPNGFLTDDDASDELSTSTLDPLEALACLEQYLGDCGNGQQGMIHATRQLVTHWANGGALRREGSRIFTIHDTIVVSDGGYDGSGPNARDDDAPEEAGATQFAYATGLVSVRLEPMTPVTLKHPETGETLELVPPLIGGPDASGVDRTTNLAEARAERRAAATWSGCCHAHVEVDLAACGIGGS